MKKELILAGICVMLTASSVLASDDSASTITPPSTIKPEIMAPGPVMNPSSVQKQEVTCTCGCGCKCNCGCKKGCSNKDTFFANKYKRFIRRVEHHRAVVYNTLNLTDEQIKTREEILKENTPIYEEKFERFIQETQRLKSLKAANAGEREINKQRHVVMNIKKDIDKTLDKENKTFRKCLTSEQRAKYDMITKLERHDFKRNLHRKDLHKSNPKMTEFGKPVCKKSCPVEKPCEEN